MNTVSKISNYVINSFDEDILKNTITFNKTSEIDWDKTNIYPLVNIDILGSNVTESEIVMSYTITIADQRDTVNYLDNDKIYGSNLIDNLNETHAIAVRFINKLNNKQNDDNITIDNITNLNFLKLSAHNNIDGVRFTVALSIYNNIPSC